MTRSVSFTVSILPNALTERKSRSRARRVGPMTFIAHKAIQSQGTIPVS